VYGFAREPGSAEGRAIGTAKRPDGTLNFPAGFNDLSLSVPPPRFARGSVVTLCAKRLGVEVYLNVEALELEQVP
jgi:hypothetical protein